VLIKVSNVPGRLGGSVGQATASGPGHDPGAPGPSPHRAPCSAGSPPLPLTLPRLMLSHSFSLKQINKNPKKKGRDGGFK